jgi:hypothetical protein
MNLREKSRNNQLRGEINGDGAIVDYLREALSHIDKKQTYSHVVTLHDAVRPSRGI